MQPACSQFRTPLSLQKAAPAPAPGDPSSTSCLCGHADAGHFLQRDSFTTWPLVACFSRLVYCFEVRPQGSTCRNFLSPHGHILRIVCLRCRWFTCASVARHLCCLGHVAVVAAAVVCVRVRDSVWSCFPSSRAQPRTGVAGDCGVGGATDTQRLRYLQPRQPGSEDGPPSRCGVVSRCALRWCPEPR